MNEIETIMSITGCDFEMGRAIDKRLDTGKPTKQQILKMYRNILDTQ